MSSTNIPAVAAGITTVLGLIGFIFYCILYFSDKASSSQLSKEIIEALKQININPSDASKLTPEKLKLLLATQTNISKEILSRGIEKEINHKAKFLLYTSLGSLTCALAFGIIWMLRPSSTISYHGYVVDRLSKQPVAGAIVEIENRRDIHNQKTDDNGLFQIRILPTAITLNITHDNYKPISIRKEIVKDSELDTFLMEAEKNIYVRKLEGTVVDYSRQSVPVTGAKIFVVGDSICAYSNDLGYFSINVRQQRGQNCRINALKREYKGYDEYISETENNILIPLNQ